MSFYVRPSKRKGATDTDDDDDDAYEPQARLVYINEGKNYLFKCNSVLLSVKFRIYSDEILSDM